VSRHDPRIPLLKELADPVRLRIVDRLGHLGPATVSQLAAAQDLPLPVVSNHLKRLREAGLVRVERTGRHAVYELADDGLVTLLPLLDRLTGRIAPRPPAAADRPQGRRCYDHLAGRLGVALYQRLSELDALRDRSDGTVELGPAGDEVLARLGIDPAAAAADRRRFAFECLDAVEHAPHLAGALGAGIAHALGEQGWVRAGDGRDVEVTPRGRRALQERLGLEPAALGG
jgi:DNA-binding transcriptional ArsR family regulator